MQLFNTADLPCAPFRFESPCSNYLDSDFDKDCFVDLFDFSILAAEYGVDPSSGPFTTDLDSDNDVDFDDLAMFASEWLGP